MSVQSEIERIQQNVASTYSVLEQAGADMPQSRNTDNLAETAASIKAVLYDREQTLTEEQKAQAKQNIGVLEPLIGSTSDITPAQVSAALLEGRNVVLSHTDATYGVIYFTGFLEPPALGVVASSGVMYYGGAIMRFELVGAKSKGIWAFSYGQLAQISDVPTDVVRYVGQTLTEEQKAKARENIGAISIADVPKKGVDYWTEADQEAIVQQVITALGTPVFGTVDGDNNIILTGELSDGTYTLKYEDAEGNVTTIGTLTTESGPAYTNVIPVSIGDNGSVFNATGYLDSYRLTGNYGAAGNNCYLSAASGYFATGFFPYTIEDCKNLVPFYVKGVDLSNLSGNERMAMYSSEKSDVYVEAVKLNVSGTNGFTIEKLGERYYKITPNQNLYTSGGTTSGWEMQNATMARLSLPGSGAGVILTVNEPID